MKNKYIYIDVDETFLRNYGKKQIPIPNVIQHIKLLNELGYSLYCWSSGGANYAKTSAEKFKIEQYFIDFLPKPNIIIDDQPLNTWKNLIEIHPNYIENVM